MVWSFGGQFLSSGGNFLVTAVVLAVASPPEYAVFSICFTTYSLAILLMRSLVGTPITLLYSGHRSVGIRYEEEENASASLAVILGCVAAAGIALTALPLSRDGNQFLILALALPFLLYQDGARHVAFARGCPALAAQSDGLWVALQGAGFLGAFLFDGASPDSLFAAWAVAGALAGLMIGARLHLSLRLAGALAWARTHWQLCRRLLLECVITSGGVYVLLYGVVIVSDAGELGRLRAAQTLLGPVSVLLLGGAALGVPESVRAREDGPRLRRFAVRLSVFLAGFTIACGTFVYLTLPAFGPHVFPNAWSAARPLLPLMVLFNMALGASTGPMSGIRALGGTAWIVRARSVSTLGHLLIGLPAAATVGASGALLGMAATECLLAIATWRHFDRMTSGQDLAREHQFDAANPELRSDP